MNSLFCSGKSNAGLYSLIRSKLGFKNIKDVTYNEKGIFYTMNDGTIERMGFFSQFKEEQKPNIQKVNHEKVH